MEDMIKMMRHIMENMARSDQLAEIGAKAESVTAEVKHVSTRVEDLGGKVNRHSSRISRGSRRRHEPHRAQPVHPAAPPQASFHDSSTFVDGPPSAPP